MGKIHGRLSTNCITVLQNVINSTGKSCLTFIFKKVVEAWKKKKTNPIAMKIILLSLTYVSALI